jgi:hypothetical protein
VTRPLVAGAAALALGLVVAAAPQPAGGNDELETTLLLKQFEAIAFSAEFGGRHRIGRIVKWDGPIRVRVRGYNAVDYIPEVLAQLRELERLSGLTIELVNWSNSAAPPNLDIQFGPAPQVSRFDPTAPCRTLFHDRNFVIQRVEVYIAPDNPAQRRHCIAEELTQALGLANDSSVFTNSIFNDDSRLQVLAPWDALMLRILYDPRIRPGMTKVQALPIAREVIAGLLRRYALRRVTPRPPTALPPR